MLCNRQWHLQLALKVFTLTLTRCVQFVIPGLQINHKTNLSCIASFVLNIQILFASNVGSSCTVSTLFTQNKKDFFNAPNVVPPDGVFLLNKKNLVFYQYPQGLGFIYDVCIIINPIFSQCFDSPLHRWQFIIPRGKLLLEKN